MKLPLYWWEGYFGLRASLTRLAAGHSPYVANFGDRLSPFVVSSLAGRPVRHSVAAGKLLAVGSIFFALRPGDQVWGSGLLNASHLYFAKNCPGVRYHAVRGPETRRLLLSVGVECPEVYGDPAWLLPRLVSNDQEPTHELGIVPHFTQLDEFRSALHDPQVRVIDVQQPFYAVIRAILGCRVVLATSLHGLIVAEAYGLPALLLSRGGDLFKFEDYFHGTGRSLVHRGVRSPRDCLRLADEAQEGVRFDAQPLLDVFPFPRGWADVGADTPVGWRPPRWFLPKSVRA